MRVHPAALRAAIEIEKTVRYALRLSTESARVKDQKITQAGNFYAVQFGRLDPVPSQLE